MKKLMTVILGIIILALGVLLINSSISKLDETFDNEKDKYSKYINTKYVLDKDTLTIIDYSIFNETFTLSNGVKINYKVVVNE